MQFFETIQTYLNINVTPRNTLVRINILSTYLQIHYTFVYKQICYILISTLSYYRTGTLIWGINEASPEQPISLE